MNEKQQDSRGVVKWVAIGCGGCAVLLVLLAVLAAVIGGVAVTAMKGAEPYREGLRRARHDPRVVEILGEPIEDGFLVTGEIHTTGPSGEAELSVPLNGPKGRGTLYIEAERSAGRWSFTTLEVAIKGRKDRVELLQNGEPQFTAGSVQNP